MSEPTNFLKGQSSGTEVLVPQLLLDGNYISYTSQPASADSEGVEGLLKTAPDGLYYFANGLWRKTPAYSTNWDDLDETVRFLPINKNITLTKQEQQRLKKALSLTAATQTQLGLVKGGTRSDTQGSVYINIDGSMNVYQATDTYAGAVRVTENSSDDFAPIVATKAYVDAIISGTGNVMPDPPTFSSRGGLMLGNDIDGCDSLGRLSVKKATHSTGQVQAYGLTHIAPPEFTLNPSSDAYDDADQTLPYVVTVSQAKGIAQDIVDKTPLVKTDYIASTSELGFVKISSGLSITSTGSLSVNQASTTQNGIVQLYDPTTDLPNTVPYMSQVKTYIQGAGYITSSTIPVATNSQIGGVKTTASGAIQVSNTGAISVRAAQPGQGSGIVTLVNTAPTTENNTVLTAYKTKELIDNKIVTIPDASATTAGKVYVALGQQDTVAATQTVPTVNYVTENIGQILISSDFTQAVNRVIAEYPFPSPFPDGQVNQVLTFTRNTTFQDKPDDTTPGIVQFYQQPKLKGTNGAIKSVYEDDDILNYRQVKQIAASGIADPIWATFDQSTSIVTVLNEMVTRLPLTVEGTITAQSKISTDTDIEAGGDTTTGTLHVNGTAVVGAITGSASTLSINVQGKSGLVSFGANKVQVNADFQSTGTAYLNTITPATTTAINLGGDLALNNTRNITNAASISASAITSANITISSALTAQGSAQVQTLVVNNTTQPTPTGNNTLQAYSHTLYWEGNPVAVQQIKTTWKAYIFGIQVGDAWFSSFSGYLEDGTAFSVIRDDNTLITSGQLVSAYCNITAGRPCTKDELYPSLLTAAIDASHGTLPVFITVVE